jgi:hypothetical protein
LQTQLELLTYDWVLASYSDVWTNALDVRNDYWLQAASVDVVNAVASALAHMRVLVTDATGDDISKVSRRR